LFGLRLFVWFKPKILDLS